jgi:hypothetical protein
MGAQPTEVFCAYAEFWIILLKSTVYGGRYRKAVQLTGGSFKPL